MTAACTKPCWNGSSSYFMGSTLIPPMAYAYFEKAFPSATKTNFIGISIYDPDQVKRTANAKQTKVSLKQKAYVRILLGGGSAPSIYWESWRIEGCKGRADVRTTATVQTARLAVKCNPKQIEEALSADSKFGEWSDFLEVLGLKKPTFDVRTSADVVG
jgi:hypothetical protein